MQLSKVKGARSITHFVQSVSVLTSLHDQCPSPKVTLHASTHVPSTWLCDYTWESKGHPCRIQTLSWSIALYWAQLHFGIQKWCVPYNISGSLILSVPLSSYSYKHFLGVHQKEVTVRSLHWQSIAFHKGFRYERVFCIAKLNLYYK